MALPGYRNINGFFRDDTNVEKMAYTEEIRLYQEMRNNDPIVVTSLDVLKSPLLTQGWDFKTYQESEEGSRARDFLYLTFEELKFFYFRYHYFLKLDFGFSYFDKVWKYKHNNIMLNRLFPIRPDTVYQVFMNDEGVDYIRQRAFTPEGMLKELDIEGKYLFHTAYNMEFDDPRGRSIFKPIRPYYLLKKNLLQNDARLRDRAAGIVTGYISANMAADEVAYDKFATTLQNIGNNVSNFALAIKDEQEILLQTPQHQEKNFELLQWYNQQIFYNTQTQFMISGIGSGANGGRANTDSHKGTYINKVNSLLTEFDNDVRILVDEILDRSEFALLPQEFRPYFETAKISEIDKFLVADTVAKMGGLVKLRPEDETWFRASFGMPEIDVSQIEDEQEEIEGGEVQLSIDPLGKMTRQCREIIELQKLEKGFATIEAETDSVIWEVYNKAIRELAEKLEKNPENIKLGKRTEMNGKMKAIYNNAKKIGKETMAKEIEKVTGTALELELLITDASTKDRLGFMINRVWDNAEGAIRQDLLNTTAEVIEQAGGIKTWLENRYLDGNKKLMSDIAAFVEGGIIDGRGEIIDSLGDSVVAWEYSAVMDPKTCTKCSPFDGQRKSLQGWIEAGMQQYSPVNPSCLGGSRCRCVLVPIA